MITEYTVQTLLENINKLLTTPIGLVYIVLLTKEWRFSPKTSKLLMLIYAILLFPINFIFWCIFHGSYPGDIFVMYFNILTGLGLTMWLQRYPFPCFFFIFVTALDFLFITKTLKKICYVLWDIPMAPTAILVAAVIGLILHFFLSRQIYQIMKTVRFSWMKISLLPLLLLFSFMIVSIPGGGLVRNHIRFIPAILLCAITYSFYLLLYYIFSSTLRQQEENEVQSMLLLQIHSLERQTANFNQMNLQLKTIRHDLRHYITALAGCIEAGSLDQARELLSTVDSNIGNILKGFSFHPYTGDPLLDSILSYNKQRAEELSIDFQVQLPLQDNLEFSMTDLAILLSNALENAINACEKQGPEQEPRVTVSGMYKGNQFFLEIINTFSCQARFNDKSRLPVTDEPGHGFGSQSILAIARRNNAACHFTAEDNLFHMQLLIDCEAKLSAGTKQGS